jgi:uncharacterized membrane protein (DUF485 family)
MAIRADGPAAGRSSDGIQWEAAERSGEFQELVGRQRRFVLPATIFFLGWYLGFIILAGYAPDFMGERIYQGFTVGYLLALTQFLMVWVLTWAYLRFADRVLDPLRRRAAEKALQGATPGRFDRSTTPAGSDEVTPR